MADRMKRLKELVCFIRERFAIYEKRTAGKRGPWTNDPILQKYRFCNVRREDDRVTKWIHNWAARKNPENLWFAFYFARVFNLPSTLEKTGWPMPWTLTRRGQTLSTLDSLVEQGYNVYNGAYMVTTHRHTVRYKHRYYGDIFDSLWARRTALRPTAQDSLASFYERLTSQQGVGSFMGAQVVADVKQFAPLIHAVDWATFAAPGPGSYRGLNWVLGKEPLPRARRGENWHARLLEIRETILPLLPSALANLDAQNLQNCLCEFDKYCRTKYTGKRPKKLFV